MASAVSAVIKQRYGGNLKVAEDLLAGMRAVQLFHAGEIGPKPMFPIPFRIEQNSATLDLTFLPPDQITEIEKSILALNEISHPCHWILDYPYLGHEHHNSISVEKGQVVIRSSEPDFLNTLLVSPCLTPESITFLRPFRATQFGFEANPTCIAGRPFLDSVTPIAVDPLNPYLSFKLNEVDVFPVPEEKFHQISADPQLVILPGPNVFLYLSTVNLTPQQALYLKEVINLRELARSVLNDHAEILSSNTLAAVAKNPFTRPVYFILPQENPYRLIGERLRIQLQDAGLTVIDGPFPRQVNAPSAVFVLARPIQEQDFDLFRYRLLQETLKINSREPWFEAWDDLEASGQILPLMIHQSRIAVRKGVLDVQRLDNGVPDFSNCWIRQEP